jgi:hypothetical protein
MAFRGSLRRWRQRVQSSQVRRLIESGCIVSSETPLFVVHLLGFALFLWLGLYVLSRGDGGAISRLTGATALVTSGLFGFGGLLEALHADSLDVRINVDRLTWWTAVAPAAMWLHLSLRLDVRRARAPWRRPLIQAAYAAAAVLIVLGTFTNIVRDYGRNGNLDVAGPLYVVFAAYVLLCAGLALWNLIQIRASAGGESVDGAAARMLAAGALCFLIGGGDFAVQKLLGNNTDAFVPWLLILVGLGAVGATVGVRGSLLLGSDVRRDFLYNATSLLVLLVPYLVVSAILVGFDDRRHRLLALLLIALITASHTMYDKAREWLDAAFFTEPVREERAAARAYVEALATQPTGASPELATPKAFDDAVRRAIAHLSDPTKMATSPLLNLRIVARSVEDHALDDNRLNRAAVLKELLLELLDGLKPATATGGVTGDAYRYYNCLYFPYVRGVSRRRGPTILRQLQERRQRDGGQPTDAERVVQWLMNVDEDTFYKWQRRGSDTIAGALRERDSAAGGTLPAESAEPQLAMAPA